MTGKIILIEGSEATGKSTISKMLSKYYGGIHFHNPAGLTEQSNTLYEYIKTYSNSLTSDSMLLLMLASHIDNIQKMNDLKASGEVVVCDRGILSSYAYNTDLSVIEFGKLLRLVNIPRLDYDEVFVLYSTKQTIIDRLYTRDENDSLDEVFLKKIDKILERYEMSDHFYPNAVKIDTSDISVNKVFNIIKGNLGD